ncbi:MAG: tannase/feruloyl esterase family alpha/beta hydrolase [Verrucomicrobiales bacterium]|nr:tannase/feruloyl esterase family alpha/beta hydrolase [Verrucomicrobiales bacterium]
MKLHPSRPRPSRPHGVLLALMMLVPPVAARGAETAPQPLFPGITPVRSCESLTNLALPNTIIESAQVDVTNGMCRVTAVVTHPPAEDRVTVWVGLPLTNWNGRFQGTGGGGFLGGHPNSLRGPVRQGFAAGATDTGHEGGSGRFALDANGRQNWQGIIDNAYLGIHEMTVVGKAVTTAFYGREPRYAYFVGGSTGGRQGLMEAQRFPEDYDGIVSACPAINWHRFVAAALWPQVVMHSMSHYVSQAKLAAATAAAVAACDADDGVTDGVIDDPFRCTWDPGALVGTECEGEPFTEADAEVLRRIWLGPRRQDGTFMWYGLERGADLFPYAGTGGSPLQGKPFSIALEYWTYYLAQDAEWDWTTLSDAGFEQLWTKSVEQYGAVLGTDDPDLTRFRDHGGKLIIYHGLADQLIPAAGSVDYYRRVQEVMGGPSRTADFARLFLVPGVDHGFHGAGVQPRGVHEAIIRWVEEGRAPDELVGEKRDEGGKVIQTRILRPFPGTATHERDSEAGAADQPPASPEVTAAPQRHPDGHKLYV